mgnify:CR=1 FL=1
MKGKDEFLKIKICLLSVVDIDVSIHNLFILRSSSQEPLAQFKLNMAQNKFF